MEVTSKTHTVVLLNANKPSLGTTRLVALVGRAFRRKTICARVIDVFEILYILSEGMRSSKMDI